MATICRPWPVRAEPHVKVWNLFGQATGRARRTQHALASTGSYRAALITLLAPPART
jgi:hypothetical protein